MTAPKRYAIDFNHNGKTKSFERTASSQALAVEDAKAGFQWRYGYWPDEPTSVREGELR